jgi:hypothetical protein
MSRGALSVGIDLYITNCAIAFVPLKEKGSPSELFPVPQWETTIALSESPILPSFLYLPMEGEAFQTFEKESRGREWICGRFARRKASESPGRVAHSAKSWLCHHAVDRHARFLPWRSDEIPIEEDLSDPGFGCSARYLRAVGFPRCFRRSEVRNQRLRPPFHFLRWSPSD